MHEATGPCCTRCHYQEELAIALQEFEEVSREALGSPPPAAPWELHVPWAAQNPASLALEPSPVFHSLSWIPTLDTQTRKTELSHAWLASLLTLATLLFFTASSHQHKVSLQSIKTLMNLSHTAHSKNLFINILLLILLCISVVSICHTVQRKNTTRFHTTCTFE